MACAKPNRARAWGVSAVTSRPSRRIRPALAGVMPEMARSSDDLPAPFAPSTAVVLPAPAPSVTSSSARTAP